MFTSNLTSSREQTDRRPQTEQSPGKEPSPSIEETWIMVVYQKLRIIVRACLNSQLMRSSRLQCVNEFICVWKYIYSAWALTNVIFNVLCSFILRTHYLKLLSKCVLLVTRFLILVYVLIRYVRLHCFLNWCSVNNLIKKSDELL